MAIKWVAIGILGIVGLYLLFLIIVLIGAALGLWPLGDR